MGAVDSLVRRRTAAGLRSAVAFDAACGDSSRAYGGRTFCDWLLVDRPNSRRRRAFILPLAAAIGGAVVLFWLLPYVALRLGFAKSTRGTCARVRLLRRGIQFVEASGTVQQIDWCRFDAFDFRRWNGFDVLKLRFRGGWLSRRCARHGVVVEFGAAQVSASSIRGVLQDRGLREEPLGERLGQPSKHDDTIWAAW